MPMEVKTSRAHCGIRGGQCYAALLNFTKENYMKNDSIVKISVRTVPLL